MSGLWKRIFGSPSSSHNPPPPETPTPKTPKTPRLLPPAPRIGGTGWTPPYLYCVNPAGGNSEEIEEIEARSAGRADEAIQAELADWSLADWSRESKPPKLEGTRKEATREEATGEKSTLKRTQSSTDVRKEKRVYFIF